MGNIKLYNIFKTVCIGSDHAGYKLKEVIKNYLVDKNVSVFDIGPYDSQSVDYPVFAKKLGNRIKSKKRIGGITSLQRSGYKKRKNCELCGFKAQHTIQLNVFFVDGNLRNVKDTNLKTVCANCQRLGSVRKLGWRVGDLVADD